MLVLAMWVAATAQWWRVVRTGRYRAPGVDVRVLRRHERVAEGAAPCVSIVRYSSIDNRYR
jgi:hypothetical protein